MSREISYRYELERQRRQQIFNERVRARTTEFYERYTRQYEDMIARGFRRLIPSEMSRLEGDLSAIRSLLDSNPAEAREISREVGGYIREMFRLGNAAEREFRSRELQREREERETLRRIEREQREESMRVRDEALREYYAVLNENDAVCVQLAMSELERVKAEIESGNNTQGIRQRLEHVIASYSSQAEKWREQQRQAVSHSAVEDRIAEAESDIASMTARNDVARDEAEKLLERLHNLRANRNMKHEDALKELDGIESDALNAAISEETRREAVKSIYLTLKAQGFDVSSPVIVETDGGKSVKLTASRPSGKRAICLVDESGKIRYRFDKYEGMSCVSDIEQFNATLQSVYSVKLSDERVLWENPMRINSDAVNVGGGVSRHGA